MLPYLLLTAAVALGQPDGVPPPAEPASFPRSTLALEPDPAPVAAPSADLPALQPTGLADQPAAPAKLPEPLKLEMVVSPPTPPAPPPAPAAPAAPLPDRWILMKSLQGTWPGALLDGDRTTVSGWTEMAFTASTDRVTNLPVTWNDRANTFLLHQNVIRLDRATDPTSTDPSWGFHLDTLIGADYRYTLARGLFQSQLLNSTGAENLYGVDPLTFYVNAYFPRIFHGTNVAVGRFLTPLSSESEETILTPLLTRSDSFNWGGPFTHTGIMVAPQLTRQLQATMILATGNEVFLDPSMEPRFVGALIWTSANKQDTVTFATTLGRGKFNAGAAFATPTFATIQEPAGRNNINVFDFIWARKFAAPFTYQLELLYGYQYGVPTTAVVGSIPGALVSDDMTEGTAHWAAFVQYFTYKWSPRFTTITRVEAFDDFNGQRTGFKGLYTEVATGFQYQPRKAVIFRPELRYDYNGYSRPFEDKHDVFTAAFDTIVRW
jgi:hypothetical protein